MTLHHNHIWFCPVTCCGGVWVCSVLCADCKLLIVGVTGRLGPLPLLNIQWLWCTYIVVVFAPGNSHMAITFPSLLVQLLLGGPAFLGAMTIHPAVCLHCLLSPCAVVLYFDMSCFSIAGFLVIPLCGLAVCPCSVFQGCCKVDILHDCRQRCIAVLCALKLLVGNF